MPPSVPTSPVEERERGYPRSGRATPGGSRGASRTRRSRRELTMTVPAVAEAGVEEIQPDWADKDTRAEVAANEVGWDGDVLQEEDFADDDDPYGELNFDGHFDTGSEVLDEEEVRRELSRGGLGKWIDGVVDVFLALEDDPPEDFDVERSREARERLRALQVAAEQGASTEEVAEKGRSENRPAWLDGQEDTDADADVRPPPEQNQGVWDDVKWLGGLVARNLWS